MPWKPSGGGAPTWIAVFLGNPGLKYAYTRHNAGFLAAEALKYKHGFKLNRIRFKAATEIGELGGQRVLFMQPQTFMNLSGEAVAPASAFYKIPPERIVVLFDDIHIAPGKLRIRRGGSDGGHNGIKSISACLGSTKYPRIKIGVGAPPHPDYDMVDWVIGRLTGDELQCINDAAGRAVDALEELLANGVDSAMNKYNG